MSANRKVRTLRRNRLGIDVQMLVLLMADASKKKITRLQCTIETSSLCVKQCNHNANDVPQSTGFDSKCNVAK